MGKEILSESEEKTLKSQFEVLKTYIKEGGKEFNEGTISGDMAMAALTIISNYLQVHFYCEDFGIDPIDMNKQIIWGKKDDKGNREGYKLVLESDGIGGTKQKVYKRIYGKQTESLTQSQILILETCNEIKEMLLDKNRKYGDSALNPKRIFSNSSPIEQINVRIDDKLSRIKSGQLDEDEDVEGDLLGYLILKKVAQKMQAKENEIRIDEEVNKRGG